jgi:hypothetical protein
MLICINGVKSNCFFSQIVSEKEVETSRSSFLQRQARRREYGWAFSSDQSGERLEGKLHRGLGFPKLANARAHAIRGDRLPTHAPGTDNFLPAKTPRHSPKKANQRLWRQAIHQKRIPASLQEILSQTDPAKGDP